MLSISDEIYMGTAQGSAVWGAITGTLSDQTDLANALAAKQDTIDSTHKLNASLVSGLANVATSGSYADLTNKPTSIANVDNANTAVGATNPLTLWEGTEYQWNHGNQKTWYYWQTSVTAMWTSSTMPRSVYWNSITYGDGTFVAVAGSFGKAVYSTDGENWTETSIGYADWKSVTYGDGKFVAVDGGLGSDKAAYSTDGGQTWTASTLPSEENWNSITYGDGKFVVVTNGSKSAYSTDGINWTASTMPSSGGWIITYGNGKFVAVSGSKSAYSTDGVNWEPSTMPSYGSWSVAYGDGKFVAVSGSKSAYSTDGVNWEPSTMASSVDCVAVTYGDGKFVATSRNEGLYNDAAYSTNGINWTASTMPSEKDWISVTYGNGKFVAVANDSNASAIFTMQSDRCYTTDQNPTTTSLVYSAPETVSSYTISSVTSGAITLSNNNTYYYNQSGNQYTYQTIGDAHPEYLCFIEGVGVKKGTTIIAEVSGS